MKVKLRKRVIDVENTRSIRSFVAVSIVTFLMSMSTYMGDNINTVMASTTEVTHVDETFSEMEIEEPVIIPMIEPFNQETITDLTNTIKEIPMNNTTSRIIDTTDKSGENEVSLIGPGEIPNDEHIIDDIPEEEMNYLDINISDEEKEILCRIVEAEVTGTGECYNISDDEMKKCKFRVARVILNRIKSERFPGKTVESIVFQKNQFSPTFDGHYYTVHITDLTREAVEMALDGSIPDNIPGGTFFTSGKGFSSDKLEHIETDSVGHKFYRYKNWESDVINK